MRAEEIAGLMALAIVAALAAVIVVGLALLIRWLLRERNR